MRSAGAAPIYMGADISLVTFMQQQGKVFRDNGVPKPVDTLMYDHGANLFRLRIFVTPQTVYTDSNFGAIQSLSYDIALAKQIQAHAPGAKLMLDFHYSDTWADPGQQTKPANAADNWRNQPLAWLETRIHDYTRDTLNAFGAAGVMPDIVQVGNEITGGMLWGTGTGTNAQGGRLVFSGSQSTQQTSWRNLGRLLNSAIDGVRDAQGAGPKIDVAIHIDRGDSDDQPQYWYGNITNPAWGNVSDFDIIGVSYYPSTRDFHSFDLLEENLQITSNTYPAKQIMILETNYPWREHDTGIDDWDKTPAGQAQFLSDLRAMMENLDHDPGVGILWWYPESVPVSGFSSIYNGGATALFDGSGNALPALNLFGPLRGDTNGDGAVDLLDYNNVQSNFGLGPGGDTDGDGDTDIDDYNMVIHKFGNRTIPTGAGAAAAVPEPRSAMLLSLGAFLLASAVAGPRRLLRYIDKPM